MNQLPWCGRLQLHCVLFFSKWIVEILGESMDKNIKFTGSGSEFDGDDTL